MTLSQMLTIFCWLLRQTTMQIHCRRQQNLSEHARPWVDVTKEEMKALVGVFIFVVISIIDHHILLVD